MTFAVFFVFALVLIVGGHVTIIRCAVIVWRDGSDTYPLLTRGAALALLGLLVATDIWFGVSLRQMLIPADPSIGLPPLALLGYYTIALVIETLVAM